MGRMKASDELVRNLCYEGAWVAPAPFTVIDCGTVVYANHAMLRILGHTDASDVFGKGLDVILHPDLLEAARMRQEIVVSSLRRFPGTPTKVLTSDGGVVHHTVDLFPLEVDGRVLTAVELDLSGWPQPIHKTPPAPQIGGMARSVGWALLEGSSTPVIVQDVDTILFANRVARDLLGVTERTEIEGRPILSIAHPDGLLSAIQRVAFVFGAHQPLHRVPTKLKGDDGRVLHVTADAYPIKADGHWAALLMARAVREAEPSTA